MFSVLHFVGEGSDGKLDIRRYGQNPTCVIHAFYLISNTRLKFANFQNLSRKILRQPCLTDPSKVIILLGVSSQVLGGELETQI